MKAGVADSYIETVGNSTITLSVARWSCRVG